MPVTASRIFHTIRSRFKALPPTAEDRFQKVSTPTFSDRIIFFSPHPDDEALAAGGFLKQARKNGAECLIVLVTDGNRRGLKELRAAEFSTVLSALSIPADSSIWLDYPNGRMKNEDITKLSHEFTRILDDFKPTVVIAPHPADLHREHKLVSHLVSEYWLHHKTFALFQYLIHYPPHYPWPRSYSPNSPLLPPTNLTLHNEGWQLFSLTPEEVEEKKKLIELYPSQLKTPVLRSLMYALIRRHELFLVHSPEMK